LPAAYCLLAPIACCLLPMPPIAYCLLPIAYCLLPIACCLLAIGHPRYLRLCLSSHCLSTHRPPPTPTHTQTEQPPPQRSPGAAIYTRAAIANHASAVAYPPAVAWATACKANTASPGWRVHPSPRQRTPALRLSVLIQQPAATWAWAPTTDRPRAHTHTHATYSLASVAALPGTRATSYITPTNFNA
jgi:hypothetical protein